MNPHLPRRAFLRQSALAGAAFALQGAVPRGAQAQNGATQNGATAAPRDAKAQAHVTVSRPQWTDGDWRRPARALRGVNLGAWLVLEKWMTPSVFAGTEAGDEWSLSQTPGARDRIERHRQSFVTEADFAWIKARGLDAVRLPIGYWTLEGGAPYFAGASHVDDAFAWANKYDLQVLLDLHGAPGSQNGWDHSGRAGAIEWTRPENVAATVRALEISAERYGQHPNLWGIECLNEPRWDVPLDAIKAFYLAAYARLRAKMPDDRAIVIHDAFRPLEWNGFMSGDAYHNVVLDTHIYQVYTEEDGKRSPSDQVRRALDRSQDLAQIGNQLWTIVGEWSDALSWNSIKGLSPLGHDLVTRAYGAAQILSYERTHGWFYWSLKTESPSEWSFRDQVERGLLPSNFGA